MSDNNSRHENIFAILRIFASLPFAESCALADAVERWWNRVGNGEQPEFAEALL